jgi:hypothetical protein
VDKSHDQLGAAHDAQRGEPSYYDREEQLVRLFQLRDQLDIDDMIALTLLEPADPGTCADCQADTSRSVYGRMAVCDRCALQRIKIVRRNRDR